MSNDYVAPINHGTGSAVAQTASGAAGGGVKGAITGWLGSMGAFVAIGALIGFGFATAGASTFLTGPVMGTLAGALGGGIVGWLPSQFVGGVSGLFGAFKGGTRAAERVGQERGAAAELSAQIEMARAQSPAMGPQTVIVAPSASAEFPRGTAYNETQPGRVGSIQHMGMAVAPQMAQSLS